MSLELTERLHELYNISFEWPSIGGVYSVGRINHSQNAFAWMNCSTCTACGEKRLCLHTMSAVDRSEAIVLCLDCITALFERVADEVPNSA